MPFTPNVGGGPVGIYDSEQKVFGRDLFFDGDLRTGGRGDYQTVDGLENYRRALIRRILTRPGEYRYRPDYGAGLLSFVRKPFNATNRAEIVKRITAQVSRDRRTEKVIRVDIETVTFNSIAYFKVSLVVQAFGRRQELRPFTVKREA